MQKKNRTAYALDVFEKLLLVNGVLLLIEWLVCVTVTTGPLVSYIQKVNPVLLLIMGIAAISVSLMLWGIKKVFPAED